jgi:uncharacterized protein YegL
MKQNRTELVFILDKSGSMSGLEADTIGGFNSLLKKQQKNEGEAVVTTVLFDDRYQLLHDRFDIKGIKPITEKEYFVEGSTALLDAMGKTIHKVANIRKNGGKNVQADKVLFVVITDGMENASRKFSYEQIRKMIKQEKKKHGWEFLFLGANIDAVATAKQYGICAGRAVSYRADPAGTRLNYETLGSAISGLRANKKLSPKWKEDIDRDFSKRA